MGLWVVQRGVSQLSSTLPIVLKPPALRALLLPVGILNYYSVKLTANVRINKAKWNMDRCKQQNIMTFVKVYLSEGVTDRIK